MTETVATKPRVILQPFAIEATHPRCADIMLQSIPNCRLRGAVTHVKEALFPRGGKETISTTAGIIPGIPKLPGMEIHVDPAKCSYRIVDPMYGDDELCKKVEEIIKRSSPLRVEKLGGVPPQKGTLDAHRMKSLCRELRQLVKAGEASVIKGGLPSLKDIEDLPGEFLLNPGSRIFNTQPEFEKDLPGWTSTLSKVGG